ncbi:MAG TPA: GTPase Era [Candidatus Acidoferrales bacterium]|nr:GTPase Era [Candidatus Acidoferrales bacterium]
MSFKAGYVALVGEPNVGKSTLLNGLLGQKLSIVTPKPQTTRHKIAGILTKQDFQIVFLDTPGLIKPRYALQEVMMAFSNAALHDADIVVFILDASGAAKSLKNLSVLSRSFPKGTPVFLALNKIDLVKKNEILPLIHSANEVYPFKEIIPVSALTGENLEDLENTIVKYLPDGHAFYPEDYVSDRDERFFVSELVREEIFKTFKEEVPYSTTVEIEEFREKDDERKTYIRAIIYVEKESQKGIIIGKKGAALKQIGQESRKQIEELIGHEVFLELFVKVRDGWRDDKKTLSRLGYK